MITVQEAREIILKNTYELEPETVDIITSLNRVLSEDIYASENIPPFNNSAMDGYAVVSSKLNEVSDEQPAVFKVIGNIPAGQYPKDVICGNNTLKIMTGAPLPEGADAVVPVEYTEPDEDYVRIFRKVDKWGNVRFSGEDIPKGNLVIKKGTFIRSAEIGMLAALNVTKVNATKMPIVSILSTGDEIVDPGEELLPGKIRNINGYSLYAKALSNGCRPVSLGTVRDNAMEIRKSLEKGRSSDILIISGGVSVGDYDYVKNVLSEMGMEQKFWKIAVKPGKPVLFGLLGKTLVFGLPGNPVSSMVAFEEFVLPAVYKLQGRTGKPWLEVDAILEGTFSKTPGLTHFVRGKIVIKEGKVYVTPMEAQSSAVFSSLVLSDCFIVVPEAVTVIKDGEKVQVQIISETGILQNIF